MTDENLPTNSTNPVSNKRVEANRRNAQKSTGPRTDRGRQFSSRNSLRHGLSRAALIRGDFTDETEKERFALLGKLFEGHKPVGATEEILVDKICTEVLRLKRCLKLEAAIMTKCLPEFERAEPTQKRAYDIYIEDFDRCLKALESLKAEAHDKGYVEVESVRPLFSDLLMDPFGPLMALSILVFGKGVQYLRDLGFKRTEMAEIVEPEVDAYIKSIKDTRALMVERRQAAWNVDTHTIPSAEKFNLVLRYKAEIERALYRAMAELERVQAKRNGEVVRPPAVVDVRV